ncbi:GOLPH3/VPS74 family protein [Actinoalloteichus hymeniacidonis]|uniref:Phosphoprotein n=1 Tax=Actinoalloteichus hymeniacidonis TaxID=340345 RepID=A0AAC9MZT8_9PSEU|nr:GPP34 family phosphoprotein [Actinoalloteichus hymeniacidonis]AOS64814.1 putative phosphoprotein [Actinoalloteichus hymeniacidonis]MBB5907112.1 hypothetical protein [Actinoalloteichus hymeniacidonis]
MDAPNNLAARLYLLACDTQRERLVNRDHLGFVLRAALLTDLLAEGALTEQDRKPTVARSRSTGDPVQADLLNAIAEERPRSWTWWMQREAKATVEAVGQQLADIDLIHRSAGRTLAIFPTRIVQVLRPEIREDLRMRCHDLLGDETPVDQLNQRDAAMVSLAAEGQLRSVFSGSDRIRRRARLRDLREHLGPVPKALRKVISQRAAAASSASSGG